jgi:putative oxidoreductase
VDQNTNSASTWIPRLLSVLRIVVGITLLRHGLQRLFGFPGAADPNFQTAIGGLGGILALPGGLLMILGLFTRPAALVLSVVMAAAYFFGSFQQNYLWIVMSGGESVVFYCVVFLFLAAAGGGSLSLDRVLSSGRATDSLYASPELAQYLLSIARILIGFLFLQHGTEKLFGFPTGMPDHNFANLRAWAGPIELVGGILIALGLFTRPTAFILSGQMAVAYFVRLPQRGSFWNSLIQSENAIYFCFVFLFMWIAGGGPWSLDALLRPRLSGKMASAPLQMTDKT